MHKRCAACGMDKSINDFAPRGRGKERRDNRCRTCRAAYQREHYQRNRKRYIRNANRRTRLEIARRQALIVQYLEEHPCVDCGETDIVVLDFDHLSGKSFDVSAGIRNRSWEAVLREIEKCEVVCANCHCRRTAARVKSGRYVLSRGSTHDTKVPESG